MPSLPSIPVRLTSSPPVSLSLHLRHAGGAAAPFRGKAAYGGTDLVTEASGFPLTSRTLDLPALFYTFHPYKP
ncbi:hypothetical protein KNP414_03426 [Paenibacillus mucilaginosus KNP414]|uniref:Uncharacterized protein n=1 Tax=Paenibacillus mucilaginosus (strain KNP414) TaxID=1036673 RepID=F8F8S2_PAEMK|nr:hypothetical protein KNP414_03426 [Paenibacillus mucilaginosus KNP414]